MGRLNEEHRRIIEERLGELWSKDIEQDFMECFIEAEWCMQELAEMDNFRQVVSWLGSLNTIKTYQDVKNFEKSLDPQAPFSARLVLLAQWMAELQDRSISQLSHLSIPHSKKQKQKTLLALQKKIKKTQILFRDRMHYQKCDNNFSPMSISANKETLELNEYLRCCLFNAVNEDNLEEMKNILDENPSLNLNEMKDSQGNNLLVIAYLRRAYFNFDAQYSDEEPISLSDKKAEEVQTSESAEEKRKANNEKIFHLLLGKMNINTRTSENKSILHFTVNSQTPPSDILFLRLKGASAFIRDMAGKCPVDYLPLTYEHRGLLLIEDLKVFFRPRYYIQLKKIIEERKGQNTTLFDHLTVFEALDISKTFSSDVEKGNLLYYVLATPNEKLRNSKWDELKTNSMSPQISDWIHQAGMSLKKTDPLDASHFFEIAAGLGHYPSMIQLAHFFETKANPIDLMKAAEWYGKIILDAGRKNKALELSSTIIPFLKNNYTKATDLSSKLANLVELRKAYHLRWKNYISSPSQKLDEQIDLLSLIEKTPDSSSDAEKKDLFKQICNSWVTVLENLATYEEKGELLYKLLTHPHTELNNHIRTYIEENRSSITTNLARECINKAGVKIYQTDKIKSFNYFKIAAEWKYPSAIYNVALFHFHFLPNEEKDFKKAIQLYLESYPDMTTDCHQLFTDLKKHASETKSSEEEHAAISALFSIYRARWNPPDQYLSEQIDFIQFLKKVSINKQEREELYQWINDALEKIIKSDKESKDIGRLFLSLLTPPDTALAKYTKTFLTERNLMTIVRRHLNVAGNAIWAKDRTEASEYYQVSADMGHPDAMFNLALYYQLKNNFSDAIPLLLKCYSDLNDEILDRCIVNLILIGNEAKNSDETQAAVNALDEIFSSERYKTFNPANHLVNQAKFIALLDTLPETHKKLLRNKLYKQIKQSYLHRTTDSDRLDFINELTEIIKNGNYAMTEALNEIDAVHWKTLKSIKLAIEALPTPNNSKNMLLITLDNGTKKRVSREIFLQWELILAAIKNETKHMDGIISLLHNKEPPVPEFKDYYAIFKTETNPDALITKCANYQKHLLSSITYWADKPDGILKLLNAPTDEPEHKKFERHSAILRWTEKFGKADDFLKLEQARQGIVSHRILEHGMSKNLLATSLENHLITDWKKDPSPAAKQVLRDFYTKKIRFWEAYGNKNEEILLLRNELARLSMTVKDKDDTKQRQVNYFKLFSTMITQKSSSKNPVSKFKK